MRPRAAIVMNGRVGNQLFQWALGQALAARGARVGYDFSWLRRDFEPLTGLTGLDERSPLPPIRWIGRARPLFWGDKPLFPQTLAIQDLLLSDPQGPFGGPRYYIGVWAREAWFASVAGRVRSEVRHWSADQLTERGSQLLRQVTKDTCAVSVRRGDYTLPHVRQYSGLLGADYFLTEMDEMRRRGVDRFLLFSDDLQWVGENLAGPDCTLTHDVGRAAAAQLALMAACGSHILSNSTFSWWGAYLSEGRYTVVPGVWDYWPGDGPDPVMPHWHRSRFVPEQGEPYP